MPGVVRVAAQLLGRDLPEDTAATERGAAARELPPRTQDEGGRAPVDLAVVHVVGKLVEVDVALLAARGLRRRRDDPRQPLVRRVRLEGELGLRVHDEALLVGERQLLVDLPGDEDLLLRVVEVVADEHRRVLVAQVTSGERLQGEDEREAHLPALGDPAKARAVPQEVDLVRLELEGLVVERRQAAQEPPLGGHPLGELLLGLLDDAEGHDGLRDTAPIPRKPALAFAAKGRLHGMSTDARKEQPPWRPTQTTSEPRRAR